MELWAYFTTNTKKLFQVNNSAVFSLIQDGQLDDNHIYTDDVDGGREELGELLDAVKQGDIVMIRSLVDLADSGVELVNALRLFGSKGVEVVSVEEPWYDFVGAFDKVVGTVKILSALTEKKRRLGMERAKMAGRMGRKTNKGRREQLQRLRAAGLPVREITELCGISRSTYYRNMTKNGDF